MGLAQRRILIVVTFLLCTLISFASVKWMRGEKKRRMRENRSSQEVKPEQIVIQLGNYHPQINLTAQVYAVNKIDIISEVNGKIGRGSRDFLEGIRFRKGDVLLKIDETSQRYDIIAARSRFHNLIIRTIPDLAIDFPDNVDVWKTYAEQFNENQKIQPLPKTSNEKEHFFIAAREIYSTYYSIKSSEERLSKFTIRAPFTGVLANVNNLVGSQAIAGKPVATFIGEDMFEMAIAVPTSLITQIDNDGDVELTIVGSGEVVSGKIHRIGKSVDMATQSVNIYIRSENTLLRDGIFVNADLELQPVPESAEIPIRFLKIGNRVTTLVDNIEKVVPVTLIRMGDGMAVVTGLSDSTIIVR